MSYSSIVEYFAQLAKSYFKSGKKKKSNLLDHAVKITGFHRKSIIRHMIRRMAAIGLKQSRKGKSGAKKRYTEDLLLPHIAHLWESMERISARRIKAALNDWLPYYHENGVSHRVKNLLRKMSASTLERFLVKVRKNKKGSLKGLCSTSPATYMKNKVPINTLDSSITRPGYIQTDTVAHCGDRLIGDFINSITFTDIFSTWTENRALFTKKGHEVRRCLSDIRQSLSFDIIAINTDSGSEFLNMPVFNQMKQDRIIFTRSRPYKKNDNCYVEQKNYTHVRQLFGYERIDSRDLVPLMNYIYKDFWNPFQNFFLPTFKLTKKIRAGAKIKKTHGTPKTPYRRLMESPHLSKEQKDALARRRKELNPFELKKGLDENLKEFFRLLHLCKKQE